MVKSAIPTIDLSPIVKDIGYEDGKKNTKEEISKACTEYGFFQVVNHGVPIDLIDKAMKLSNIFFAYPDEEKDKSTPGKGAPVPAGYSKQPPHSPDKNEYLLMFPPDSNFNVLPTNPPEFREKLEELFNYLVKTGEMLETILNDCLGLPPNFLKQFNHDRSWDLLSAKRYYPATKAENNGILEHEDGNIITFVIQDEAGGLQVRKNGVWIPVVPEQGTIVVNIGVQVLTNNKFKSATQRVIRPEGRSRYSFSFFYNIHGDEWIEPLPEFTKKIGESPKYRGFFYKGYQALRVRNKTHPPSRPEDIIHITHYSVNP